MAHQKGEKREHCSLGHQLEIPIMKKFVEIIPQAAEYHGLRVRNAYSVGLAAKKGKLYAKDSIDFVLSVEDPKYNRERKLWGFEAKGRVTLRTAEEEAQHLILNSNPHVRINEDEVSNFVARVSKRFQIIQHAYVYNFDTVVLAIADSESTLIRTCIVDYTTQLKNSFGKVLSDLKDLALQWAYPENMSTRVDILKIPEEIAEIAEDIPTINGFDTLQGTANLWHTLRKQSKPIPSLHRLIPSICAYWNSVKGGSDTTTKLMDDCILQIPKSAMNMETVCITRLLQALMVLCHRQFQCMSNHKPLDDFDSLLHWRHAASYRFTFHKTLLLFAKVFATKAKEKRVTSIHVTHTPAPISQTRQVSPMPQFQQRQPIDGITPSLLLCAPTLSTKTPRKIQTSIRDGSASSEIMDMVHKCVGIPVQKYPTTANNPCAVCKKNTSWYCMGCKQWICLTKRTSNINSLYYHSVRGEEKYFVNTCFHSAHEKAWERHWGCTSVIENITNNADVIPASPS